MTISEDPRLPGLDAVDSRWLVRETQRVLTDLGLEASSLSGDALILSDERVMGLGNLSRTLGIIPRKHWEEAVRDQLSTLVRADPTLSPDPADLRAKLMPREAAEALLEYDALEPLPGLVALIAAQLDGMSTIYGRLDQVGDRDEAYDTALSNLASLPLPTHTRRRADKTVATSWVEFLDSGDSYGASRVLVLPDLMRRVLGREFPPHGVLVAVPTKFELWVHVPVDESVADTAVAMSWLSLQTWAAEPYPVSPDVFLVSPDMHAVRLVVPDQEGANINREVMFGLLDALESPLAG